MRISHFFIDRPIFATVLSIVITILGARVVSARCRSRSIPRSRRRSIRSPANIRAPTPRSSPRPWPRRSSRRSTASRTCSTCRRTRPTTAASRSTVTLRARHQSRHGAGAGAEPRLHRGSHACRRKCATWRHRPEDVARPDDGRAPVFAGQVARHAVHLQLRHAGSDRRGHPRRRRRPITVFGGARLRDAGVARSRPHAVARNDGRRRHQGAAGAEHPGRGRHARSAAGRKQQGAFQITVQTLGRLADPEEFDTIVIKETPSAVVAIEGRRQGRTGGAGLLIELLSRSLSGGRARHLPAPRLERAGDRAGACAT